MDGTPGRKTWSQFQEGKTPGAKVEDGTGLKEFWRQDSVCQRTVARKASCL